MKRDLNEIAEIEKAIKDRYGSEAIQNPKKLWDDKKEKKYLKDLKEFYKESQSREKIIIEKSGFSVKEKKKQYKVNRKCPVCSDYSFAITDDLYMIKFKCCRRCYIQYVESREERWKKGWRPKN